MYRTLLAANALYSPDRGDNLPASARRIREQIGVLELLRKKQTVSKAELLPYFGNSDIGFYRYLNPLFRIGLVKKQRVDRDTILFHFDKTVELDLAEESRRVRDWIANGQNGGHDEAVTVETPVGFLKLQPILQTERVTE